MKASVLHRLDTVQLVPPTPFTDDGQQVVGERLTALVGDLRSAGMRVFLPAAGTGEFHSLSVDEVVQCVRATKTAVHDECTVIAPIGLGVDHAVAIGKRALDAGADALLLMPVVHPYVSDEGFRDYFLAIAARLGPVPMLTYKRGPAPSDKLLLELARAGKLLGVKYAVNDLDAFGRFAATAKTVDLGLYCGTAERWAPYFMLAGATGFTSGSGCVAPRASLHMHRSLTAREFDEAMRLLAVLRPLEDYRAKDGESFNIAAIKYAVSLRGGDFGPCRPPQRRLTDQERAEIRRIVEVLCDAEQNVYSLT